jgi:hypothetical protein
MSVQEWREVISSCNVIVTTFSILHSTSEDTKAILNGCFSNIFVDEAHHAEAATWKDIIGKFTPNKVTLFTATPFRNDGKRMAGKFIYTFTLKSAQQQGYYKPINLLPVREYDSKKADNAIAEKAVNQLRKDIADNYNHILMARCSSIHRANQVFSIYKQYTDLNPILISSKTANKKAILDSIKSGKHKIIVCVNMLGEGFDLPELKIAAVHDVKKSLTVTLQFIGRFTRTSYDKQLGNASFVVNLADPPQQEALQQLYSQDADWDALLPQLNDGATQEEVAFKKFIQSFKTNGNRIVSLQNISPALSMLVYRVNTTTWNPNQWENCFPERVWPYRYVSTNDDGDTIVLILGRVEAPNFGLVETVQNLSWYNVVVHRYCTPKYNHIYINSSLPFDTNKLVEDLCNETGTLISGNLIFRVFHDVKRFMITSFGGKKINPGLITFKSMFGKDVQDGISDLEAGRLTKNNIFGTGYRHGERQTIGCSIKGKIWSYMRSNLHTFIIWAREMGALLENSTIDPHEILSNTLIPKIVHEIPNPRILSIEWNEDVYINYNRNMQLQFRTGGEVISCWDTDLSYVSQDQSSVIFKISINDESAEYKLMLNANNPNGFEVSQCSGNIINYICGGTTFGDISDYLNTIDGVPNMHFVDGSFMQGSQYFKAPQVTSEIPDKQIIPIEWDEDIDLKAESQGVNGKKRESIQYKFIQYLTQNNNFDILYDDDGAGEIADIVAMKDEGNIVQIFLYHLKYAHGGKTSNSISNFYEVCGQAQKSLKWKDLNMTKILFKHLFLRVTKKRKGEVGSRIIIGSEDIMDKLKTQILSTKKLNFNIAIVQPALVKGNASSDIKLLLGSVDTYMKEVANIPLIVYCSKNRIK